MEDGLPERAPPGGLQEKPQGRQTKQQGQHRRERLELLHQHVRTDRMDGPRQQRDTSDRGQHEIQPFARHAAHRLDRGIGCATI